MTHKITVDFQEFQEAIASLPKPMIGQSVSYSGYFLESTAEGVITIESRNLLVEGKISLDNAASNKTSASFVLDPNRLLALTWQASDIITFVFDSENGTLKLDGTRNKISVDLGEDYTRVTLDKNWEGRVTIPASALKATPFVSVDMSKQALCNVFFRDNSLYATDSFRLYGEDEIENEFPFPFVLSPSFLELILREGDAELDYYQNDEITHFLYCKDSLQIKAQTDASSYPQNIKQLVPDYQESIPVNLASLSKFLNSAKKLGKENLVNLISREDGVFLVYQDEAGELELKISDETVKSLDITLAIDKIKDVKAPKELLIKKEGSIASPVIFRNGKRFVLVMPVHKRN